MKQDASSDPPILTSNVSKPASTERPEAFPIAAEGDWLCEWCLHPVANEQDRFAFHGRDEFAFSNPEGIRFEILTFSRTLGGRQIGLPTLEHTWFPGHAWTLCQCGQCGQQLGWFYIGEHNFAGLIKIRIVRAVCVRN